MISQNGEVAMLSTQASKSSMAFL